MVFWISRRHAETCTVVCELGLPKIDVNIQQDFVFNPSRHELGFTTDHVGLGYLIQVYTLPNSLCGKVNRKWYIR